MTPIETSLPNLRLIEPNPLRDAPITLSWFESSYGKETLLLMGNAEHEIGVPSLESEIQTLEEFIDLKEKNVQLTWMIQTENKLVGVAWIELVANHSVQPPSVHLMIGDKEYRGKGIGKATMLALIDYIKTYIETNTIYSRHLKHNVVATSMNRTLGFIDDGSSYIDKNQLEWQNVKLAV